MNSTKLISTKTKMSWENYKDKINKKDSFITRYLHFLRVSKTFNHLSNIIKKNKPVNCLDIGCNRGYYSNMIANYNVNVDAIDINLKNKELIMNENIEYKEIDFLNTEFDKSFDLIIMLDVLEHVPIETREFFFEKAISLLSTGGVLLFSGPNKISPYYFAGYMKSKMLKLLGKIDEIDWHYRIPFYDYHKLFKKFGLSNNKWDTVGIFPVLFNFIEKIIPARLVNLMLKIDIFISKIFKGFGANYFCVINKV